jgi:hypothetical protein
MRVHALRRPRLRAAVLALAIAAVAGFATAPALAAADPSDAASTQTYLQGNYTVVRYFTSHIPAVKAEISSVLTGVRRECPLAAAESPENVDSEQLSNEVIGAMVTTVTQHNLPYISRAIRAAEPLRWSNSALTRTVQAYVAQAKALTKLAVPHLCADVQAWVASDFQTLPASTVSFAPRFLAAWVAPGFLPSSLAAYETPAERTLAHRTAQLEQQWAEFEAGEVETWAAIMNELVLQP